VSPNPLAGVHATPQAASRSARTAEPAAAPPAVPRLRIQPAGSATCYAARCAACGFSQLAGNGHCTRHCSLHGFNRPAQRTAKRHASPPAAPPGRGFYSDRCTIRLSYRPQPKNGTTAKKQPPPPQTAAYVRHTVDSLQGTIRAPAAAGTDNSSELLRKY